MYIGLCLVAASASIIKLLANSDAAASANTELRLVYSAWTELNWPATTWPRYTTRSLVTSVTTGLAAAKHSRYWLDENMSTTANSLNWQMTPADSEDTRWNYLNQDVIQQSDRTFSVCGLSTSGTSYHRTSWRRRQSIRSRTGWIDTDAIWAFKADSYIAHQPQVTSNKKRRRLVLGQFVRCEHSRYAC